MRRLLVQSGALLGKGGARITQIRTDSGATVRLVGLELEEERSLPRETGTGQHRVLCISGESTCVLRALSIVTDLLRDCQVSLSLLFYHLLASMLPAGIVASSSLTGHLGLHALACGGNMCEEAATL